MRASSLIIRLILSVGILFLLLPIALSASVAEAHAILLHSDPPVNTRLLDPPERVKASFTEPLRSSLSYLQVLDGGGKRVDSDDVSVDPLNKHEMSISLQQNLPPGYYTVVWQTLSTQDGHMLKGSYPFTLLNPDGSDPIGPHFTAPISGTSAEPKAYTSAARWLVYLAIIAFTGTIAFILFVARPANTSLPGPTAVSRSPGMNPIALLGGVALIGLVLAAPLEFLAQTQALGGLDRTGTLLDTVWGERWLQRQAVLAFVAIAWGVATLAQHRDRAHISTAGHVVTLAGCILYLLLLATVSHASSVAGSFWALLSDFVHLLATALWIGMLVPLTVFFLWAGRALAPRERSKVVSAFLHRYSAIAAVALLVLLATGVFNAFVQVSSLRAMVSTPYGRALFAKLALILPLLAVTGLNAVVLRPPLKTDSDGKSARLLSRLIPLECALGLAILAIVAVLVYYPTPRQESAASGFAEAGGEPAAFEATASSGDMNINLSIAPNTVGTNSYEVYVFPIEGQQLPEVLRVRLRFQAPDPTQGPSEIIAEPTGQNSYRAAGSFFTAPGSWAVEVDIRRAEAEDVVANFQVPVARAEVGVVGGGRYDFPLVAGNWLVVAGSGLLVLGIALSVGLRRWPFRRPIFLGQRRVAEFTLAVVGIGLFVGGVVGMPKGNGGNSPITYRSSSTSQTEAFNGKLAMEYQASDGRVVVLEVSPFEIGENAFRLTVMDQNRQPTGVSTLELRFRRLETTDPIGVTEAIPSGVGPSYLARYSLDETGWWDIEAIVDGSSNVSYYLRLDQPSQAPLHYAAPDYASDPSAEALFRQLYRDMKAYALSSHESS